MSQFLKAVYYHNHLLVVKVIIQFTRQESFVIVILWLLAVIWLVLRLCTSFTQILSICFHLLCTIWIIVANDRTCHKPILELFQGVLALFCLFLQHPIMCHNLDWSLEGTKAMHELVIEICISNELLYFLNVSSC